MEKRCHIRCNARRDGKRGRILGGLLVDHGQPRFDRRAMPRIDRSVDGHGEDHTPARLQPDEGVQLSLMSKDPGVMATSRPPGASRASAEATCRKAASGLRPATWVIAENGGFITTTEGKSPGSR